MAEEISVDKKHKDSTLDLALDTLKNKKQALIFVNSKRSAEKGAEDIAKKVKENNEELNALSDEILNVLSRPTVQCERLAKCIKSGIAFHHAGLRSEQKDLIEEAFRKGLVKIIVCTPTLAAGVDLPAFRAILQTLRRYTGFGLSWIPVLEYMQMSGRAGRPGYDKFGEAIAIAETEAARDEIKDKYIYGEPENIYSKLAVEPVLRTYVLSLIATGFVRSKKQIMDFFSKTFWAYQYSDMEKLASIIEKMLRLLQDYEFITSSMGKKDDFSSADEFEDETYSATLMGRKVAELYIDPLTANYFITSVKRSSSKQVTAFSLLQMICHTLEMRPLLSVRMSEWDKIQEELNKHYSNLIVNEPSVYDMEYEGFMDSVKTALFLHDWVEENDEVTLLEKYNVRPGEVRVKIETADWLLYAAEELCKIIPAKELLKHIIKLRVRLEYGVREELLALVQLRGIGRVRARKLYMNRIKDLGDVKKTDLNVLSQIIGTKNAIDVKKQVGENVADIIVKENKRKGQINLKDFNQ